MSAGWFGEVVSVAGVTRSSALFRECMRMEAGDCGGSVSARRYV